MSRKVGANRASAEWFLNMAQERRPKGWSRSYKYYANWPAHSPMWDKFSLAGCEFHPARRFKNSRVREYKP